MIFSKSPCKVCEEKENRIADLKLQILSLERLIFPPKKTQDLEATDDEVDDLFNSPEETIIENMDAISVGREAQLLLSGDYDGIHGEV